MGLPSGNDLTDGGHQCHPALDTLAKGPVTAECQLIDTTLAAGDRGLPARDEALAFEPVEGGIDAPLRDVEDAVRPRAQSFDEPITVRRAVTQQSEEEQVELAARGRIGHT
jgi:hypothetical protein